MSVRLMSMVWDIEFPTQSQKLLALKMADHANDEGGSIWPSKSRLARQTGASESTIQLGLKVFRQCGLLHVLEMGGIGPRSTTKYTLNVQLIEALSRGMCSLVGCSDNLELEGDIPIPKGLEIDPLEGSTEEGVDFRSHQPGGEKGVDLAAKGSAGRPQTINNNHHKESSGAPERASEGGARAPAAKKQMVSLVVTPKDAQWDQWLNWLRAANRYDLEEAALHHREITVYGSRWPSSTSVLPHVEPLPGLTKRSQEMTGETAPC